MPSTGLNRADPLNRLAILLAKMKDEISKAKNQEASPADSGALCIFLSHKREDTEACEPIADYIMKAGADVYFDKTDTDLAELVLEGNPDAVTAQIQKGIDSSTHMLCVVSEATVRSYWVPFEVGYGYNKVKRLGVLTLKGISDSELPDYMRTTNVVRGTKSLNDFIAELLGEAVNELVAEKALRKYSELPHPLDKVLDWAK